VDDLEAAAQASASGPATARRLLHAYWEAARQMMNLLAGDHSPRDVVDQIARAAKCASGADAVAVVRAPERGPLRLVESDGIPDEFAVFL
jgi:hypothetical protein